LVHNRSCRLRPAEHAACGLKDTYGSLLAAAGVDLVTIQAMMGHGALVTTGRYLHACPAADQAAVFTRAFQIAASVDELVTAETSHDDSPASTSRPLKASMPRRIKSTFRSDTVAVWPAFVRRRHELE
jgi:hypothetical protein